MCGSDAAIPRTRGSYPGSPASGLTQTTVCAMRRRRCISRTRAVISPWSQPSETMTTTALRVSPRRPQSSLSTFRLAPMRVPPAQSSTTCFAAARARLGISDCEFLGHAGQSCSECKSLNATACSDGRVQERHHRSRVWRHRPGYVDRENEFAWCEPRLAPMACNRVAFSWSGTSGRCCACLTRRLRPSSSVGAIVATGLPRRCAPSDGQHRATRYPCSGRSPFRVVAQRPTSVVRMQVPSRPRYRDGLRSRWSHNSSIDTTRRCLRFRLPRDR